MDIETIREYCLGLPCTSEDSAFGEDYLLFRVCDKIFACFGFDHPDYFVLKCDPEYARELRDSYAEVTSAWHWNKKILESGEPARTSYRRTHPLAHTSQLQRDCKKLPKRIIAANPEIMTIE